MEYAKGKKTPQDSEWQAVYTVREEDLNVWNQLFGGRLMEWIDKAAGIAASQHCDGLVVTAAVNDLHFISGAALGDRIELHSKVTYVGRTSLEVRVDVYKTDPQTGMTEKINQAYVTEVYTDSMRRPRPVAWGLDPVSDEEKKEYQNALKRIDNRKMRQKEGF